MELRYAGKFVNNEKDYEGGTIDVYDNIDPDIQVDEKFVKTQCKNDVNDGDKAAKGKGPMYDSDYVEVVDVDDDEEDDIDGYEEDDVVEASVEASLHSVPIYEDSGDESDKEI
ncbi:hypothetical protein ACE6H2_020791 [Prunus campanulata]